MTHHQFMGNVEFINNLNNLNNNNLEKKLDNDDNNK